VVYRWKKGKEIYEKLSEWFAENLEHIDSLEETTIEKLKAMQ